MRIFSVENQITILEGQAEEASYKWYGIIRNGEDRSGYVNVNNKSLWEEERERMGSNMKTIRENWSAWFCIFKLRDWEPQVKLVILKIKQNPDLRNISSWNSWIPIMGGNKYYRFIEKTADDFQWKKDRLKSDICLQY